MATIDDFEKLDIRVGKVSEVLTLGVLDAEGRVILIAPDFPSVVLDGRLL